MTASVVVIIIDFVDFRVSRFPTTSTYYHILELQMDIDFQPSYWGHIDAVQALRGIKGKNEPVRVLTLVHDHRDAKAFPCALHLLSWWCLIIYTVSHLPWFFKCYEIVRHLVPLVRIGAVIFWWLINLNITSHHLPRIFRHDTIPTWTRPRDIYRWLGPVRTCSGPSFIQNWHKDLPFWTQLAITHISNYCKCCLGVNDDF